MEVLPWRLRQSRKMAKAIVKAVNNYDNPAKIAEISKGIDAGMKGISADMIPVEEAFQEHCW